MPELPEVETTIRVLQECGVENTSIRNAMVLDASVVAEPGGSIFTQAMRNRRLNSLKRRGKYIVAELDQEQYLLVHLRMSGRLALIDDYELPPHTRLVLELDNNQRICFHDPRRFGRVWLTGHPESILGKLGIEPLSRSFTAARLETLLKDRKRTIKPLLLDQHIIAGIGNIYADEALWEAGIHPLQNSAHLNSDQIANLHRAIRKVLQRGIRNLGTSLGAGKTNFRLPRGQSGQNREKLRVYARTKQPCPRCKTPIVKTVVAQRGTHWCPACQPNPQQRT
jgi:formamidopyrimidine-DNA glycosylase